MPGSLIRQKIMEIQEQNLKGSALIKALARQVDADTKSNQKLVTKKMGCKKK